MFDNSRILNMALLMRFLVFFLVAGFLFMLFFWVMFLKGISVDVVLESSAVTDSGEDFSVRSYRLDDDISVMFSGVDVMRFSTGSSFDVESVSEEEGFYTIALEMSGGSVWVANMGGVLDLQLKSGDFMFQNVDGYYYVERTGDNLYVYAYKHPVRVYFLGDDGVSLNSYLLPEGYYVELVDGLVNPVVGDLRYAKIVKEYPFYSLVSGDVSDEWKAFANEDDNRYKSLLNDFETLVRQNYNSGDVGDGKFKFFYSAVDCLRGYLTFSDTKKEEWAEQDTLKNLNTALYLSVKGDGDGVLQALMQLEESSVVGDDYKAYLSYLNVILNNSLYDGDLYPVKDYLRGLLYGDTDDGKLVVLRDRLNEMYDLVAKGNVATAKMAFSDYERGWWDFLGMSVPELLDFRKDISEERELLSVLLLSEDGFYDAKYFDLLEEFEQAIFRVAVSGFDLDEERQAFVASKIKVVNKVEDLLAVSSIDVDVATDLLIVLLDSSDFLMDEIESEAAVLTYYRDEIDEGWLVTKFVNSIEYSSLSGSFDDKFQEYLKKEQDIEELKSYLQSEHLGADQGGELTLSEAKQIVYADLSVAGISYTAIVSVGDSSYRLFEIQGGEIGGVAFSAKYDRESRLIYDLEVGDVSFATGVHIDALAEVISAVGSSSDSSSSVDNSSDGSSGTWSYSEKLAISMLEDYLVEYGIVISEQDVVFVDVNEDLFSLEGVLIDEKTVDFTVWAKEDLVTGVTVDGEDVEGEFEIGEFAEAVL